MREKKTETKIQIDVRLRTVWQILLLFVRCHEQAITHVIFRFCAPTLPNFHRAYLPYDRLNSMFHTLSNSSLKKIFILQYLNASWPLLESMWFKDYRSLPALQSRSVNICNTVNWRHAMKSAGSGTLGNISRWILELIPLSPVNARSSPCGGSSPHQCR